jgi:transposase-like protein
MRFVEADLDAVAGRMPNLWSLVKSPEEFWGDLSTNGRRLLKVLLEGTLELWRDGWVKVEPHKPSKKRRTYRNGYYRRKIWVTELGTLSDVRVPRCRDKGLTQRMLARIKDHRDVMADSVIDMLLAGVSTRRVGELLERIIDLPVSAGQVSRLAKRLDAEVRAFHSRPLQDEYLYVLFDGIHLKARGTPRLLDTGLRTTKKRVLLVAYGVTAEGVRRIIDFRVANSESVKAWSGFLENLYRRGLKGERLELITTDGCGGLISAVETVYPCVTRQRCWFHKMQNISGMVRRRDREEVLKELRQVYAAENRREAEKAAVAWGRKWKDRYERAVQSLERDLPELLAVFDLPAKAGRDRAAVRRMLRTTNPIERRFREVRRRTRSIGTFRDDRSIERIVYGLVAYFNSKYAERIHPAFKKRKETKGPNPNQNQGPKAA